MEPGSSTHKGWRWAIARTRVAPGCCARYGTQHAQGCGRLIAHDTVAPVVAHTSRELESRTHVHTLESLLCARTHTRVESLLQVQVESLLQAQVEAYCTARTSGELVVHTQTSEELVARAKWRAAS